MVFRAVLFLWEFLMDVLAVSRLSDDEKELELLLLRQQLRIVERRQERGPQIPRWQKVPLAMLAVRLKKRARNGRSALEASVRLFRPATIVGWHRAIVRRKWTYQQRGKPGRPPIDVELEGWILQVARDNPGLGYEKLAVRKLGFQVSKTTVSTVLERHGILPAPERGRQGSSWRVFLNHYKDQFLACDFFTVETLTLQTLYVLFFLEHGTRRAHVAGCTAHPTGPWVAQQARQMTWALQERELPMRYLIHDHDTKFTDAFDTVFEGEGVELVDIPYHAPNANAHAERWVRTIREECLDKVIILNERHLRRVLHEYAEYYNTRRPHQGLEQDSPAGMLPASQQGTVCYRKVLGGVIRDCYREAA